MACPAADIPSGYYGDYLASVMLPRNRLDDAPYVITAYAESSGGCNINGPSTFDQHVHASAW